MLDCVFCWLDDVHHHATLWAPAWVPRLGSTLVINNTMMIEIIIQFSKMKSVGATKSQNEINSINTHWDGA